MKRIRLLTPLIANQIAAGEVIENPASVVKELLENSLDAGATKIAISIASGGLQQIKITDNGSGIHSDDLMLALSRHGTSKIATFDDLANINSLGFRGEALASISAVAQVSLTSCVQDATMGATICVRSDEILTDITPSPHLPGTTIEVNDLFFNTPARRKFLRSERTEFLAIIEQIRRLALSRLDVRFEVSHNQRNTLLLPQADTELSCENRLVKLLNQEFIEHAVKIAVEVNSIRLTGWIAFSNYHRRSADLIYFYVNGRMVRDKVVSHAIRQAYAEFLPAQQYPACVLFLEIPPHQVDVNVHPTKHEVRFHEARLIHDFIFRSLNRILKSEDPHAIEMSEVQQNTLGDYSNNIAEPYVKYEAIPKIATDNVDSIPFAGEIIARIHNRYLIIKTQRDVIIVDGISALQQIIYHQLQQEFSNGGIHALPLMMPIAVKLTQIQCQFIQNNFELFKHLSLDLDLIAADTALIRSVSPLLINIDWKELLTQIINDGQIEIALQSMAKLSATAKLLLLPDEEVNKILVNHADILLVKTRHLSCQSWKVMTLERVTALFET